MYAKGVGYMVLRCSGIGNHNVSGLKQLRR